MSLLRVCTWLLVNLSVAWAQVDTSGSPAAPTLLKSQDAFDRADVNHNGVIDRHEFDEYTTSIKKALDPFLSITSNQPAGENVAATVGNTGRLGKVRQNVKKFWSGFVSGILTIWATEIGDKTFFIAAIMSMKQDRIVVFSGAIGALIVMTVLSVVMGGVAAYFLPPEITHYVGAFLFLAFGAKMLYDAREMKASGPSEELTEVEEELTGKKSDQEASDVEGGEVPPVSRHDGMIQVFYQSFLLTFLAEWGDRSQIATITLSAANDAFGVTLGAILGHSMCTGLAVVGGKFLASRISEKTVTIVGGVLFLIFAFHSFAFGPESHK